MPGIEARFLGKCHGGFQFISAVLIVLGNGAYRNFVAFLVDDVDRILLVFGKLCGSGPTENDCGPNIVGGFCRGLQNFDVVGGREAAAGRNLWGSGWWRLACFAGDGGHGRFFGRYRAVADPYGRKSQGDNKNDNRHGQQ